MKRTILLLGVWAMALVTLSTSAFAAGISDYAWNVTGTGVYAFTVGSAKESPTDNAPNTIYFDTTGAPGWQYWEQNSRVVFDEGGLYGNQVTVSGTKFVVDLDKREIKGDVEDYLVKETGLDVVDPDLLISSVKFTGSFAEPSSKNPDATIKGKIQIKGIGYDYGTSPSAKISFTFSYSFTGTGELIP
jgi:hypothetical protein